MIVLQDDTFDEQIKGKTILIEFGLSWCSACYKAGEIMLNVIAKKYPQIEYGLMDMIKNTKTKKRFKFKLYPTCILFKDGVEVDRVTGLKRIKDDIVVNKMNELLNKNIDNEVKTTNS